PLDSVAWRERYVEPGPLRHGSELGILDGCRECAAQQGDGVLRRLRGSKERPSHCLRRKYQLECGPLVVAACKIENQGNILQFGYALGAELQYHCDPAVPDPVGALQPQAGPCPTGNPIDLVAFKRQRQMAGSRIAGNDFDLGTEQIVEDIGINRVVRSEPRGSDL